jgi:hypothetical protein
MRCPVDDGAINEPASCRPSGMGRATPRGLPPVQTDGANRPPRLRHEVTERTKFFTRSQAAGHARLLGRKPARAEALTQAQLQVFRLAVISMSRRDDQELPSPGRPSLTTDTGVSRRRSAARAEDLAPTHRLGLREAASTKARRSGRAFGGLSDWVSLSTG